MEFSERERLVRRVINRTFYGTIKHRENTYNVKFSDPTLSLMSEADWKYKKIYDESKTQDDVITLEDSYEILKKDGVWSDAKQLELDGLYKDIKELQSKLPSLKFHKVQERAIKETIDKGKKRIQELESIKNQLWSITIDFMADRAKKRFIISNIASVDGNPNHQLLSDPNFLDALCVYYYNEGSLSEAQMRELARTDPWRLYWTVSKDTSTPLFPHSLVETTELQYALLLWSRIYDFAYESTNRPTEDIIKDDDKFDAWYRQESDRLDAEVRKQATEQAIGSINGPGGQEVFIPADVEGAREVYQLNDVGGRIRIAQRQKAILDNGVVAECDLPDVARDLKLEANRLASQGAKNRSK
jgi:hypothetical protein